MTELMQTPLYAWHKEHKAKMAAFAGWDMPIQYTGILAEHEHTRTAASLFDISHMGEFELDGDNAAEALAKATSHNLETLKAGKCRYGFLLNEEGNVLDDLIVYRKAENSFMLVVNGACEKSDFEALSARMPANVSLRNISAQTGKIDLQGPLSLDVLEHALGENFHDLGYFSFRNSSFDGVEIIVSRTGYTGELGYELYTPWESTSALWDKLMSDERVKPAGLGARDTLRLEAGLPLYGHELDDKHTPAEAGMGAMLTSTANFVGKEHCRDIRQVLVALELEGRRAARNGDALTLADNTPAGIITSGSFAPSLGKVIAFAWVDAKHVEAENFVIQTARAGLNAKRVSLPFYTQGTARRKLQ